MGLITQRVMVYEAGWDIGHVRLEGSISSRVWLPAEIKWLRAPSTFAVQEHFSGAPESPEIPTTRSLVCLRGHGIADWGR